MPTLRVLDALDERDRATLGRICATVGVPLRDWRRIPGLRVFEIIAVESEADRIELDERCSRTAAVTCAAIRLGVEDEGHRRWIERARAYAADGSRAA